MQTKNIPSASSNHIKRERNIHRLPERRWVSEGTAGGDQEDEQTRVIDIGKTVWKRDNGRKPAPWPPKTSRSMRNRSHNSSPRSKRKKLPSLTTKCGNGIESGKIKTTAPIVKLQLNIHDARCFWEMGNGEGLNGGRERNP